jgi:large subunit ribosomal protein L15
MQLQLNKLPSITKKRKRVGRGGGRGGTSGKGHKGQRSRSGSRSELKSSFEGGQMPLSRRLPRRGFTNPFKTRYKLVSLKQLQDKFDDGEQVNEASLRQKGLVKGKQKRPIKVLGTGILTKSLTVSVDVFTKGAVAAIEKVGGKVEMKSKGE